MQSCFSRPFGHYTAILQEDHTVGVKCGEMEVVKDGQNGVALRSEGTGPGKQTVLMGRIKIRNRLVQENNGWL